MLILVALSAAAFAAVAGAQDIPVRPVDAEKRAAIVEAVAEKLTKYYIDPDVAEKMVELLRRKLAGGEYDNLEQLRPFVSQLTEDLHAVSNDQHLGVWPIEYAILTDDTTEEERRILVARARYENFGFMTVKRLPGNIGYLELSYFEDIDIGGDSAVGRNEAPRQRRRADYRRSQERRRLGSGQAGDELPLRRVGSYREYLFAD